MTTWTADEVRDCFLGYFERNDHKIIPSGPLVPEDSQSLIFTSAGMVQFMDRFLESKENNNYHCVASSQRCIRAGGKHNDLERVGYTSSHHTFFEMLGNFSFGDYFKEKAIIHAWTLLTKDFGLKPEKLLVTVHTNDEESATLWKKISGYKIIPVYEKENFWSLDEERPCGPCSEIFYDQGKIENKNRQDNFVEIWNLVFLQYRRTSQCIDSMDSIYNHYNDLLLARPSIDTGMGLERIVAVLQGVCNNYETTIFTTLIQAITELTGSRADGNELISTRIIADHIRSSCFLISEGVLPSNEGRGYVLRRIMRRAMCHVHLLNYYRPLMHRLVQVLISEMEKGHPHLTRKKDMIESILLAEEESFQETLERGIHILRKEVNKSSSQLLSGKVIFKLHDTYGFPLELTKDILIRSNRNFDLVEFKDCMEKKRETSRCFFKKSKSLLKISIMSVNHKHLPFSVTFLGNEIYKSNVVVIFFIVDKMVVNQINEGCSGYVILDRTPFYAESGGQVGDTGWIVSDNGDVFSVDATIKFRNLILHHGFMRKGSLRKEQLVLARIDVERRLLVRTNHSATHLLHATLKLCLGPNVAQVGSLVTPDYLRFDFSYRNKIKTIQISLVEEILNRIIRKNMEVTTEVISLEEALERLGEIVPQDRYNSDEIRIVSIGKFKDTVIPFSVEPCCGTHVQRTGEIGYFRIFKESSLASGVRRIEARTGQSAENYAKNHKNLMIKFSEELSTDPDKVIERLRTLKIEYKNLKVNLHLKRSKEISGTISNLLSNFSEKVKNLSKGTKIFISQTENFSSSELRLAIDSFKRIIVSGIIVLLNSDEDKATLSIGITSDLTNQYNAIDFVKRCSEYLGGKSGGGRPDLAQSGELLVSNKEKTLESIRYLIEEENERIGLAKRS